MSFFNGRTLRYFFGMKNLKEKMRKYMAIFRSEETNRFDPTSLPCNDGDDDEVCFAASVFIGSFEGVSFSPLPELVFVGICP